MKKHEIKRAIRIHNIVQKHKRKVMTRLLLVALSMFALPAIAAGLENPNDAKDAIVVAGTSVTLASMAIIGNIDDSSDRDAAGGQIGYKVWLIEKSQIDDDVIFPSPNVNREVGAITLLPGEVMHYFEAHDIPTLASSGERGDINSTFSKTFTMIMSGNREKLLDFCEEKIGLKFIILFQGCETSDKFIIGNPCKPIVFKKFELKNDKEGRYVTLTFENDSWRQAYKYVGPIQKAAPVTLAPGSTTLAVVPNNDQYVVPDGSSSSAAIAAVSGLTDEDKGRNLTVRGAGSDNAATIEDGAVFILQDGATWTATAGSSIVFRVLDTGRLIEVEGSRIQA